MDPLVPLARSLWAADVRFVLIGVAGANYYSPAGSASFPTKDRDLFLPPDPENLGRCWSVCETAGLQLWIGNETLDRPRDRRLADLVVGR